METTFGPIIVKGLEKNCKVIKKFFERPKIDFKIHFLKYNFVHIKKLITHEQMLNLVFWPFYAVFPLVKVSDIMPATAKVTTYLPWPPWAAHDISRNDSICVMPPKVAKASTVK